MDVWTLEAQYSGGGCTIRLIYKPLRNFLMDILSFCLLAQYGDVAFLLEAASKQIVLWRVTSSKVSSTEGAQ